jgi:hypothetical protein
MKTYEAQIWDEGEKSWRIPIERVVLYSEAQEEISALKSSLNCGDLCAEVTELKAEAEQIDALNDLVEKKCRELKAKLSRLTAMIEDDEVAENVAMKGMPDRRHDMRRYAINDYRAMLKEAVKEEKNG